MQSGGQNDYSEDRDLSRIAHDLWVIRCTCVLLASTLGRMVDDGPESDWVEMETIYYGIAGTLENVGRNLEALSTTLREVEES